MKKTDNYGAIVKIENIVGDLSKVDENSLFTLLTRLAIKKGRMVELRSWRDKMGVQSFGRMKGDFDNDAYFSSDNAEYLMRRVAAVAVGLCLETPLQELDSVKEFSAEELAEAWPRLRYGIYI